MNRCEVRQYLVDHEATTERVFDFYRFPESRPIGNGRMGTMVWTSPAAVHLQINRVDVFAVNRDHQGQPGQRGSTTDYCGGIAGVVVHIGGQPFAPGQESFRQRLSLENAECTIEGKGLEVRCFISADSDLLVMEVDDRRESPQPLKATVSMLRNPEVRTGEQIATSTFIEDPSRIVLRQRFRERDYHNASAVVAAVAGGGAVARSAPVSPSQYPVGNDPQAKTLTGGALADDVWAAGYLGEIDGQHNPEDAGLNTAIRTPIAVARAGRGKALRQVLERYYAAFAPLPNGMSLFEGPTAASVEHLGLLTTTLQEALVQSVSPRPGEPEVICVFPAWPTEWDASFRLLARGGFLVSSEIKEGQVAFVEIESQLGEDCRPRDRRPPYENPVPWAGEFVGKYLTSFGFPADSGKPAD